MRALASCVAIAPMCITSLLPSRDEDADTMIVTAQGWKMFDHGAHLAAVACGYLFVHGGSVCLLPPMFAVLTCSLLFVGFAALPVRPCNSHAASEHTHARSPKPRGTNEKGPQKVRRWREAAEVCRARMEGLAQVYLKCTIQP